MPRKPTSALDALARHEELQLAARERGETLRRAAALELGAIVLGAGGAILGPDGLRRVIDAAVAAQRMGGGPDRLLRAKDSSDE